MAASHDNMRRYRRQTVRILVDHQSEQGTSCDYATTLGAGGLFIECDDPLPMGAPLKLRFRLPGGEELHELEARVKWSRSAANGAATHAPGMGIQFTDTAATAALARELDQIE